MRYFISYAAANEKISKVGQWTLWESKWCRVKHISPEDGVALLHAIDYPVKLEYLDRHLKVLRSQNVEKGQMQSQYLEPEAYKWDIAYQDKFPDEIIIPDEFWMEFLTRYVTDKDIIIKDTTEYGKYAKMAVPYSCAQIKVDITRLVQHAGGREKSGVEHVLAALEMAIKKTPIEHDDRFTSHELATSAIYHITRNTNLLGKTVPLPPGRSDSQTVADLADAAAILICEIDRIIRNKSI